MNYVIAILDDRLQAESAYSALEQAKLPMEQVSLVGAGYKTLDEFEFLDPQKQARKRALTMLYWLAPFGFIGGFAFNLSTAYNLVPALGSVGNHLLGGVFGAIAGAMGSFFAGGGINLAIGNKDTVPYRDRVNAGKYLVLVNGAPNITNQATRILKDFKPEHLQNLIDPTLAYRT
jgi:hypothetical protein